MYVNKFQMLEWRRLTFQGGADVICVPLQTSIFSHCIELCVVVSSHIGFLLYSVDCAVVVIY